MKSHGLQTIPLGQTGLQISPMGTGAWQWGDRSWDYGKGGYNDQDIEQAFHATLDAGINWIDTAEVYGFGKSETILGNLIKTSGRSVLVATKFFPFPWRLGRKQVRRALEGSLNRLGLKAVDLYQVHWPLGPRSVEHWAHAMAEVQQAGLTRAVGVSNFNLEQTRRSAEVLKDHGIPLASNQLHYSLLNRKIETDGVLDYCRENQITVIAYSPIEKGILSGKYSPEKLPSGMARRQYTREYLERVQPLIHLLREIGQAHEKTPSQVALNWVISQGAVPIPGAKNLRQATENAGAMGWQLSQGEKDALDRASWAAISG